MIGFSPVYHDIHHHCHLATHIFGCSPRPPHSVIVNFHHIMQYLYTNLDSIFTETAVAFSEELFSNQLRFFVNFHFSNTIFEVYFHEQKPPTCETTMMCSIVKGAFVLGVLSLRRREGLFRMIYYGKSCIANECGWPDHYRWLSHLSFHQFRAE